MQNRVDNPVETMVDLFAKKFGITREVYMSGSMYELPLKYVIQNLSDADSMVASTRVEAVEEECESVETCTKHLIIDGSETENGLVKLISKYKGETRFLFIKESENDEFNVNSGPSRKMILTRDNEHFENVFNCFEFTKSFTIDIYKMPQVGLQLRTNGDHERGLASSFKRSDRTCRETRMSFCPSAGVRNVVMEVFIFRSRTYADSCLDCNSEIHLSHSAFDKKRYVRTTSRI